jgi:hypothetical protein
MSKFTDNTADNFTAISGISAVAQLATQLQPIISFIAGCVAILSGCVAIWYYLKKGTQTKTDKLNENNK